MPAGTITRLAWQARWRAPLVLQQGLVARRTTLRLPEADGRAGAAGPADGEVRRVVALGDSAAAGVGVEHNDDALVGQIARGLADRSGHRVEWAVLARTGITAGEAMALLDPEVLADADLVVVSIGANDTKEFHPLGRWRRELGRLLDAVLAAAPKALVVLLPVPEFGIFPALRPALARTLQSRADLARRVAITVVESRDRVRLVQPRALADDGLFAADGFHPSSTLHRIFADAVLDVVAGTS